MKIILSDDGCPALTDTKYSPNLRVDDTILTTQTSFEGEVVVKQRIDDDLSLDTQSFIVIRFTSRSIVITEEDNTILLCSDLEWREYNTTDSSFSSIPSYSLSFLLVLLLVLFA